MKLQEYLVQSERTLIDKGIEFNLLHASCGIITESAELVDAIKRYVYYGKDLDIVNVGEEIGDIYWYLAIPIRELDLKDINVDYKRSDHNTKLDSVDEITQVMMQDKSKINLIKFCTKLTKRCGILSDTIEGISVLKDKESQQFKSHYNTLINVDLPKVIAHINLILAIFDLDLEQILDKNIYKLQMRYPDKFTEYRALNRHLYLERAVLES